MWCAMITGTGREEQMQRACERHIDNKALLSKCFLPLNPMDAGVAKKWKSLPASHAWGNAFRRILAAPLQSALMQYPALHRYNPRSIRRP